MSSSVSYLEFAKTSEFPCSLETLFDWHLNPRAFQRLVPPWEGVKLTSSYSALYKDAELEFKFKTFGIPLKWVAKITELEPNQRFVDQQISGPFAEWTHEHLFRATGEKTAELSDQIKYRLPGGFLGQRLGSHYAASRLEKLFKFRHEILKQDLLSLADKPKSKILITGSSGLIGSEIATYFLSSGHKVLRLVRSPSEQPDEITWNPSEVDSLDLEKLEGVDGVINLAGEPIFSGRWSDGKKDRIQNSRVVGTKNLSQALAKLKSPPKVLISASGINFYGKSSSGDFVTDSSPAGEGFLADVCQEWEAATEAAKSAGIRVVNLRLGIVLSPRGGALSLMLPAFRARLGIPLGSGEQALSWISLHDLTYLINHLVFSESISGPVNAVAPFQPEVSGDETPKDGYYSNKMLVEALGDKLGTQLLSSNIFSISSSILTLTLGELAEETLLSDIKVSPSIKLKENGFSFYHDSLKKALDWML